MPYKRRLMLSRVVKSIKLWLYMRADLSKHRGSLMSMRACFMAPLIKLMLINPRKA